MNPVLEARQKRRLAMAAAEVQTRITIHGDGDFQTFNRIQDCNDIADDAKARHNLGFHGSSEMKHAARIPLVIIEKYCNDNGVSFADCIADPAHARRIVQDPKNGMFRIWKGNF